ncbi:MAG: NUDIX domain-containing protein [Patescibacteria group bacterium]|jgi:8-oxo-dGTP diphosphatase|nr:NUDIX domain-containing protein [Patescibacteria group bacterium]
MSKAFQTFTISQVAILIRNNKCLILEFADNPGYWGLPGGRIDQGEEWETAFRRELKEELNLVNFEIIDLIDFAAWYTQSGKAVSGVAYLIKNDHDPIKLSREHSQFAWASADELDNYHFIWPQATRMLLKGLTFKSQ